MTTPTRPVSPPAPDGLPVIADDTPVMYEDEGQDELGESTSHTESERDLMIGVSAHLHDQPRFEVFCNLDLHYHRTDAKAYVSPDLMVVEVPRPLPDDLDFYRIGQQGPAPLLVIEILSRRSVQQHDLTLKPEIYARLGVEEYILVDGTGEFLSQRLVLWRRVDEERWSEEQDADGGVTSKLGFRIVIEEGRPRVIDARTGRRYLRPDEAHAALDAALAQAARARSEAQAAREQAEAAADARRQAEERLRALQAELRRLRGEP